MKTCMLQSILATVLVLAGPLYPCSIEILSIEYVASRAVTIVTGRVVSVDDHVYRDPVYLPDGIRVVRSARFCVDHVLKGTVTADTLSLSFAAVDSVELIHTPQCIGWPYERGDYKLLMLGEPEEDGAYKAPRLQPGIIPISALDPAGSALFEYVSYVAQHGRRPVELSFEWAERLTAGQHWSLRITVINRMPVTLTVLASPGSFVAPADNQALLLLPLYEIGYGSVWEANPDTARFMTLAGGETGVLEVNLANYYELTPAIYGIGGIIYLAITPNALATGQGALEFRDSWNNFGPQFRFEVVDQVTPVTVSGWAAIKRRACGCAAGEP